MNASFSRTGGIMLALVMCLVSMSYAQEVKKFATKGTTELGGNISFQSQTPVSNGNTGEAMTVFTVAPYIGYFVTDGFELGVNPFGITSLSSGGSSVTQVMIMAAPSYNFKTQGNAYPFIEALFGYTSISSGSSSASGFSWGGRAGAKITVTDKGLFNLGIQYLQVTTNPDGATSRYGSNQLAVSAGFTIWI